ncbi:MAG TPA: hypothetical protein VMG63_04655, partial [Terriglobia bacterium]|nr:hypothetical protein [Terriglobia bacterium]
MECHESTVLATIKHNLVLLKKKPGLQFRMFFYPAEEFVTLSPQRGAIQQALPESQSKKKVAGSS